MNVMNRTYSVERLYRAAQVTDTKRILGAVVLKMDWRQS
jgi:hypothetical protein